MSFASQFLAIGVEGFVDGDWRMSDFTVIREVSRSLKKLLDAHFSPSLDSQLPNPAINVALSSPKELETSGGLSVWLYRARRNGELTNCPPPRPAANRVGRTPLPLDLHYLVTPVKQDPETDQVLLGRVMQVFHDHASLHPTDLTPPLRDEGCELRVTLETVSLEELAEVWHALQQPYQLSISYHVQYAAIDSQRPPTLAPDVSAREVRMAQVLSSV